MNIKHPQEDKLRVGGFGYVYCEIAESEFSKSVEIEALFKSAVDESMGSELEDQYFKAGVKTILFAALSIEAAINDYAAWQLSDNYFDKHLSSLDVISKWVIIPKLVCGRSLDKSGPAYSALKKLMSARNSLAHNKSRQLDLSDPNLVAKLKKTNSDFGANILNAYRAVVLLSLTMDKLIGHQFNPLKSFDKRVSLLLEIPENIDCIVNDCRNIIARTHS